MKNKILALSVLGFAIVIAVGAQAVLAQQAGTGAGVQAQQQQQLQDGTGDGLPDQNQAQSVQQVQLQNGTGEGSMVQQQRMSQVGNAVQEMLQMAEQNAGVDQQLRNAAQVQMQTQEQLEANLEQVQSRSGLAEFFIGPNYNAINAARELLEQNREQIRELNEVKNQLMNQAEQQNLAEQIQIIEQANQEVENSLEDSQKGFSLLGWLFRLFAG